MVRCVYGSQPYTHGDHCKGCDPCGSGSVAHGIEQCYKGVGRVERGHGGEYVGIAGVQAVKYVPACDLPECSQACHLTFGAGNGLESMSGHIPWWCRRMNIVAGKSYQIDQQEYYSEMQIFIPPALEIEPEPE